MDFDFKKEFRAYSNERLYDIVSHPDQYSNVAVSAAEEILREDRGNWQPSPEIAHPDSHPVSSTDIFADMDLSLPEDNVYMKRLKIAVQVTLAITFSLLGLTIIGELSGANSNDVESLTGEYSWMITAFQMVFVGFISFLWFRGKRWGYILVFLQFIVVSAALLKLIWNLLSNNQGEGMIELALYLLAFFLYAFMALLLYQEKTLTYFNVTTTERNRTIISACVLALRAVARM